MTIGRSRYESLRIGMRHGIAILAIAIAIGACGSSATSDRDARVGRVIEACEAHDGVAAFDDEAVICGDQTAVGERATRAVAACRGHDGVTAFDDDIVICGDETSHEVRGG
jgi:hypothetical protein